MCTSDGYSFLLPHGVGGNTLHDVPPRRSKGPGERRQPCRTPDRPGGGLRVRCQKPFCLVHRERRAHKGGRRSPLTDIIPCEDGFFLFHAHSQEHCVVTLTLTCPAQLHKDVQGTMAQLESIREELRHGMVPRGTYNRCGANPRNLLRVLRDVWALR